MYSEKDFVNWTGSQESHPAKSVALLQKKYLLTGGRLKPFDRRLLNIKGVVLMLEVNAGCCDVYYVECGIEVTVRIGFTPSATYIYG